MSKQCACPASYPDWHLQDIDLSGKPVHSMKIASFMFMPLSYENYAERQQRDFDQLDIAERWPKFILTKTGLIGGRILRLPKSGETPSRFTSHLSDNFKLHGLLHDGGVGTIKNSVRKLQNRLFDKGRMPKELYLSYLTCPECSEQKGGEKVLLLRRWIDSPTLARRLKK